MIRKLDPMTATLAGACALALIGAPMAVMAQSPGAATAGPASAAPASGPAGGATLEASTGRMAPAGASVG